LNVEVWLKVFSIFKYQWYMFVVFDGSRHNLTLHSGILCYDLFPLILKRMWGNLLLAQHYIVLYASWVVLKIVQVHFKCWILLKPVLRGVGDSLHLTVPSMNRLNQTEHATFSILPCWAFFRDSYFLYCTISVYI
jgi:hypothetical protein